MPPTLRNRNIFFTRTQSTWEKDQRLLASHPVYHIGRFFSLIGSGVIAFGLLCKFLFSENNVPLITITVSVVGCVIFMIGVGFLAVAAYKSQMAVIRHKNNQKNQTPTISNGQLNSNDHIITEILATQQNVSPIDPVQSGTSHAIN